MLLDEMPNEERLKHLQMHEAMGEFIYARHHCFKSIERTVDLLPSLSIKDQATQIETWFRMAMNSQSHEAYTAMLRGLFERTTPKHLAQIFPQLPSFCFVTLFKTKTWAYSSIRSENAARKK
ncbi:hypothetical protein D5018_15000 [Parashewanella curva]|uniref:Uncharacterized protein n=1 Tax=Parashewanella curva TaxID=2338552 RepID=A0A3L8PWN6_9GAMM|nr:hypothetical protein [Parashewanella curva]RLV58858.1 hypothetical protein D5018_15000 [Parashewanella curva]